MQRAALAAAVAFVLALSTSALATSCSRDVVAQIRFTGRQACWTYRGLATSFIGKFSSGQTVSAQMTGEAIDYDPRSGSAATVSRPRDPNVEGPGGFFYGVPDRPGVLTFIAPSRYGRPFGRPIAWSLSRRFVAREEKKASTVAACPPRKQGGPSEG
jgi:hypothetical protein